MRRPSLFVACGIVLAATFLVGPVWMNVDVDAGDEPALSAGASAVAVVGLVWAGSARTREAAALRAAGLWLAMTALTIGLVALWTVRVNDVLSSGYNTPAVGGDSGGGLVDSGADGLVSTQWSVAFGASDLLRDVVIAAVLAVGGLVAVQLRHERSKAVRTGQLLVLCLIVGAALALLEESWIVGALAVAWAAWAMVRRPAPPVVA